MKDAIDFDELRALRKGVPAWAVAVELVARDTTNPKWGGWGENGRRAIRRAINKNAIRFCGENGIELAPLTLAR